MKSRRLQFDARENTASSRQHAPRPAVSPLQSQRAPQSWTKEHPSQLSMSHTTEALDQLLAGTQNEAREREAQETSQLLTVQEVAELLRVPVSWVYERTRRRSSDRLPGIRLGKYWRFNEADLIAWLAAKRTNDYHHA